MKLVDILAREMGSWPEGMSETVGQGHKGYLHGYAGNGHPNCQTTKAIYTMCDDYGTEKVTRPQWQAAVDALKAERVVEWDGDGLPPVGVDALLAKECKFTEGTRLESFPVGTVVYVGGRANFGGCDLAVIIIKGRHFCGTIIPELLKPIRTPEQIAADERLHEVRNACTAINHKIEPFNSNIDCSMAIRMTIEAMIDAGYRKFEIVDN